MWYENQIYIVIYFNGRSFRVKINIVHLFRNRNETDQNIFSKSYISRHFGDTFLIQNYEHFPISFFIFNPINNIINGIKN